LQELRFVAGTNAESIRFSATHGRIPPVDLVDYYQLSHGREFRAGFLSRDTRRRSSAACSSFSATV
jgi:hypothetical protein